jgi:prepilin-type N-terminal cleavage/methylation domain-containing protein
MKTLQKGFTLIELMIVVAIIGILAAVAIPSYQDYITKAKLSKISGVVAPLKTAIALYYQEQGGFVNTAGVSGSTGLGWTSLGITMPSTTNEVIKVNMTACTGDCSGLAVMASPRTTDLTGASANMVEVQMNNIKKGTIDGGVIIMRPNVNEGGTNMTWSNFCRLGDALPAGATTASTMDPAVFKYFNIPGTACAVPF